MKILAIVLMILLSSCVHNVEVTARIPTPQCIWIKEVAICQ